LHLDRHNQRRAIGESEKTAGIIAAGLKKVRWTEVDLRRERKGHLGHQRTNQVFTNATLSLAVQRMGYTYDNIGQLKTATGKLADGSTAWGTNKWGYAYDAA
jgi:hypothetical protein